MAVKRIYLKDLHRMMDGMSIGLAEKVHLLFMKNYINCSDYGFRDEWQVDDYMDAYYNLYSLRSEQAKMVVNQYVVDFMEEWKEDAPAIYRRAKDDLVGWINSEWYGFECPDVSEQIKEIERTEKEFVLELSDPLLRIAEMVKAGKYEEAAGGCYAVFRRLAKIRDVYPDWFKGLEDDGELSKMTLLTLALVELYSHLRQMPGISKRLGDEMNIQLEVFNLETGFFGDMECDTRWSDMVCGAKEQYYDYSVLEECPMWKIWVKEDRKV
jgi:hypothetical protein